jgi:hypothetical protein
MEQAELFSAADDCRLWRRADSKWMLSLPGAEAGSNTNEAERIIRFVLTAWP